MLVVYRNRVFNIVFLIEIILITLFIILSFALISVYLDFRHASLLLVKEKKQYKARRFFFSRYNVSFQMLFFKPPFFIRTFCGFSCLH